MRGQGTFKRGNMFGSGSYLPRSAHLRLTFQIPHRSCRKWKQAPCRSSTLTWCDLFHKRFVFRSCLELWGCCFGYLCIFWGWWGSHLATKQSNIAPPLCRSVSPAKAFVSKTQRFAPWLQCNRMNGSPTKTTEQFQWRTVNVDGDLQSPKVVVQQLTGLKKSQQTHVKPSIFRMVC